VLTNCPAGGFPNLPGFFYHHSFHTGTAMTSNDRYQSCLETMYGLRRFGIILGLSTIRGILAGLGDPQNKFQIIHVAGTNGKGSVASALATIFRLAGYKAGLYTSPHLVRFNERIRINGRPISDNDVVTAYEAVRSVHRGDREPTFFEFSTAMAFHEFARRQVDWAIIETGMGGRLDATNIVHPALSIITNISLEHQEYLGDTLRRIAGEKAGIVKKGVPVVTGVSQKPALSAIFEQAEKMQAPVYRLGREFRIRRHPGGERFTYHGISGAAWKNMQAGLSGRYQAGNAALAAAACEILNTNNTARLPESEIRKGLLSNQWPGRLEFLKSDPTVLLDGAHNVAAIRALAGFLAERFSGKNITLVSGVLDDKAYPEMLDYLLPLCSRAVFTKPKIDRSLPPDALQKEAEKILRDITVIPDVAKAVNHAVRTSRPEDVVCISGSLYLVGEVKEGIEEGLVTL
jgi:dihydrofolate synthase/folylpolyglutamate synthase